MKKTDILNFEDVEKSRLAWQINRQIQQEMLETKLMKFLLKPQKEIGCLQRYPEAMQPMIRDFMRKAEEQIESCSI